jgi:hypothetical protein
MNNMNLPEDIIKKVNKDNWEELWDGLMITPAPKEASYDWEYVYIPDVTKDFIKALIQDFSKS